MDPAVDRQVLGGGLQVLADGEDLDAGARGCRARVARTSSGASPRPTMMPVFTRPSYSPASRRRAASASSAEAAVVAAARPRLAVEARHGLHVVGEDLGRRAEHDVESVGHAAEVRGQDLDRGARVAFVDGLMTCVRSGRRRRRGRSSRSTEVITAWRSPMTETASATCSGSSRVDAGLRTPRGHGAEAAAAGADVAQDHEGGRAVLAPALVDVRAAGLLADGMEAQAVHELADLVVGGRRREPDAQPLRPGLPARRRTRSRSDRSGRGSRSWAVVYPVSLMPERHEDVAWKML